MALNVFAGLGAAAIFVTGSAFAQNQPVVREGATTSSLATQAAAVTGPGSFPVGPMSVFPGINLAYGHDDNLFLRPASAGTRTSNFSTVNPYARAEAKTGPHTFRIGLDVIDGRYMDSPADNYTDYGLSGSATLVFSARANLAVNADYRHGHDQRGSTDAAPTATPNQYNNYGMRGVFGYGAPGARGRIEINASAYTRRYTNNQFSTESIDHDTNQIGGTFFWRAMPRTELLAQVNFTDINYLQSTSTQDSTEKRYLVGAKWEATAATTGYAKFGRQQKDFDSSTRQQYSGSSWDVGVRWSPLTYSVFDFVTAKQTGESTGVGDAVVGRNYGVTWSHAWSSRLRTQALATYRTDTFTNTLPARVDDTSSYGLRADYDFRRWLRLGATYTYSNRDSTLNIYEYKRNLFMFTLGATL